MEHETHSILVEIAKKICFTEESKIYILKLARATKLSHVTNLGIADEEFIGNVSYDIEHFLNQRHTSSVLLFPPVNNFRRFLIHQICENYRHQYDLATFSVGQGPHRRTVVCFKIQLLDPNKFSDAAVAADFELRKKSPIKSWRSERKPEVTTPSSLPIAIHQRGLVNRMGVEKNSSDGRLNKASSVDIYRPPALRNCYAEMAYCGRSGSASSPAKTHETVPKSPSSSSVHAPPLTTEPPVPTTSTSISCNTSPAHTPNQNIHFDDSITPAGLKSDATMRESAAATPAAAARMTVVPPATNGQQRQTPVTRRERRPDRAVYIPRARRSQTTPPTTAVAVGTPTTTVSVTTPPICNNAVNNQQQLPITSISTVSVSTPPSSKLDEIGGRAKSKKLVKSSSNKERKERVKKSSNDSTPSTKISTLAEEQPKSKIDETVVIASTNCECCVEAAISVNEIPQNCLKQFAIVSEAGPVHIPAEIIAANDMNTVKSDTDRQSSFEAGKMPNLRIEDVSKESLNTEKKCDIEEQEFQRASKEINRSNRRIIKQTFVSDVLEIPDKIEQNIKGNDVSVPAKLTGVVPASPSFHSGVDSTTEEEDDWESMFDDSGECLDPKIMQELTSSVGKIKIQFPKMDYSAYLTKQSILNDEEFPHVLEVSNFPVEFKNQDLLMVFSQYKESGFDIKWVDDTHALAVFSSSRIAAEVLTMGHPFVILKPLREATVESRLKAKKCAASLQPYRQRPETCAALARRLVTGALGVRLKTAAAERENEKRVLREAKERKLLAAKQRDEAWES